MWHKSATVRTDIYRDYIVALKHIIIPSITWLCYFPFIYYVTKSVPFGPALDTVSIPGWVTAMESEFAGPSSFIWVAEIDTHGLCLIKSSGEDQSRLYRQGCIGDYNGWNRPGE